MQLRNLNQLTKKRETLLNEGAQYYKSNTGLSFFKDYFFDLLAKLERLFY